MASFSLLAAGLAQLAAALEVGVGQLVLGRLAGRRERADLLADLGELGPDLLVGQAPRTRPRGRWPRRPSAGVVATRGRSSRRTWRGSAWERKYRPRPQDARSANEEAIERAVHWDYRRGAHRRSTYVIRALAIAAALAALLLVLVSGLISGGQECKLIEYGGLVQPEEPRTTCDPPWAPESVAPLLPEELPEVTADPEMTPPAVRDTDDPVPVPETRASDAPVGSGDARGLPSGAP